MSYKDDGKCGIEIESKSGKTDKMEVSCNETYLNLESKNIVSVEGFQDIKKLRSVNLSNNRIEELGDIDLNGLTSLQYLKLSSNKIEAIEKLGNCPKLKELDLSDNKIEKIEKLNELTNLVKLSLSKNKIKKIVGLGKLKKITELDLSDNKIKKIQGLKNLKELKILNLSKNGIKEIGGLGELTKLEQLYLKKNKIKKIKGLDKMKRLVTLQVTGKDFGTFYKGEYLVTSDTVRLLNAPNEKGKIITHFKKGDLVFVKGRKWKKVKIAKWTGFWINVNYKGSSGWVFSPFLSSRRNFIKKQFLGTWKCSGKEIWFSVVPDYENKLKLVIEKSKGSMSDSRMVYVHSSEEKVSVSHWEFKIVNKKLVWSQENIAIDVCRRK
jgi:hypothetical protein